MSHHGQDGGWWESNIQWNPLQGKRRRTSEEVLSDLKELRLEVQKELREQKHELAYYRKDIKRLEKILKKTSDDIRRRSK